MKKISVMIVDDEKLVMEDLKTLVDWDALGFEIAATAFNGRQALGKYKKYHPQVVFTDVRMPFMDGLELIQHIRELDSKACIFLLTAYEDFSYARTAIKYGIKDYVIKSTLDEVTFSELLKKLFQDIMQQTRLQDILKENQILEYLEAPEGQNGQELMLMYKRAYYYILVEQDMPVAFADDMIPEAYICPRKGICSVIEPVDIEGCELAAVSQTPERRILLVLDIREVSQRKITESIYAYARQVRQRLLSAFDVSFTVYVLDRKITFAELKKILRENRAVFRKKYFLGCGEIYRIEGMNIQDGMSEEIMADITRIQSMIHQGNMEMLTDYLEEVFNALADSLNDKWLKSVSREMYMLLKKNYSQLPKPSEQDFTTAANVREWLDCLHIKKWFEKQFDLLMKEKERVYQEGYSRTTLLAIEYIYRHYREHSLTIKDIAERVHLSIGHLCGLFKRETGKTLNSYITEVRIEAAKKLLSEGEMKIYEVSFAVGYQSSQYFSQIFLKMTGIFPTDWQKDVRRQ